MPTTEGWIEVDPGQADSVDVEILGPSGSDVTTYTTQNGSSAHDNPATITAVTEFHVVATGEYRVVCTFGGVTIHDQTVPVGSYGTGPAVVAPVIDDSELADVIGTVLGGGSLPAGGTTGQVLTKASNADGDADWETSASAPSGTSLQVTEILVTEQATSVAPLAVTGADDVAGTFTVAGDHAALFPAGSYFEVNGSTANDGFYRVISAAFGGGATTVTVETGTFADSTANGTITPSSYVATVDMAAGSLVHAIHAFNLGAGGWAADEATLRIMDNLTIAAQLDSPYYDGLDLKAWANPYNIGSDLHDDPGWALGTNSANSDNGSIYGSGILGTADFHFSPAGDNTTLPNLAAKFERSSTGPGVLYQVDDVVTVSVIAHSASEPIVPAGVLLVRVLYWPPATRVAAAFAG